ncbi:hypothetical protein AX774_g3349 [Zancudomyces culisetae]|uniref:Uncharacterized protein n=1 Tax=Zancudomyces culisetae TaxID=1213189 RepID=A0A1R1PQG8_ZANCU|nr:hypothetical protein AX774_g5553 [Zancudomyces culisetae]OMH83153.1 hypothetical protein AX774_g3349 [Zancudomyces culisetae]|eukprot:OMH80993.1 hypothetical protein AX774_g5553 [Zancudomyces culisetae]
MLKVRNIVRVQNPIYALMLNSSARKVFLVSLPNGVKRESILNAHCPAATGIDTGLVCEYTIPKSKTFRLVYHHVKVPQILWEGTHTWSKKYRAKILCL